MFGIALTTPVLHAQFVVKLAPQTVAEFDAYTRTVEDSLNERWHGPKNFLAIDDDPANRQRILAGEVYIQPVSPNAIPVSIKDGLIHDWRGAIYLPHTTPQRVLGILQDFDNHKHIYPAIADSRLVERKGENDLVGYWRLQQKGIVPVILEVEQEAHYAQLGSGKWNCRAYARHITEVDATLFNHGHRYPEGEGHGYLWRLYAYWTLEAVDGGVLAECRTLSLSRDIPESIAWAVAPYIRKTPMQSLTSTLSDTRKAALH